MLEEYQKFRLVDEGKKGDLLIEVNWNEKDEDTNNCKILKLTYPDGMNAFVKKEYLISLLFVIGTAEEQRDMIPQKIQKVKWYETTLSVKAKKDIRKGESIVFPIKITLPAEEKEVIGGIKKVGNKQLLTPK